MNREIKFKFWCKGTSDNLNFNKPGWWTYPNFLLQKYHGNLDIFESPDFEVCQYTGLKDKNGKEIYEGDILYVQPKDEQSGWCQIVVFENGAFMFNSWVLGVEFTKIPVEVIGNIFENPELLD